MSKPILSLDFDGCVHAYNSRWTEAHEIPDGPVPGALDFLRVAVDKMTVAIFSSRCVDHHTGRDHNTAFRNDLGIQAMKDWFAQHGLEAEVIAKLQFWHCKPPAHVSIDDRAWRFDGDWSQVSIDDLLAFKPWNHHLRHP